MLKAPAELRERPHRYNLRAVLISLGHQDAHIEGMRLGGEIERQNGEQHQHAAKQCVEEKLDCRVLAPRAAPDPNEKIHRQEHHFPENIKEKKIESAENSHHSGVEQEKQRK